MTIDESTINLNIPEIGMSDMEIIEYLICRHKVAVIPGVAFGIENRCCIRDRTVRFNRARQWKGSTG